MRISVETVQDLFKRIRDASRTNFPLACVDLFDYLDQRVPDNSVLLEFNAERESKWSDFLGEGMRRWEMPTAKRDRESLAYDLFRSVGERGEDGRGLLHYMYGKRFSENVDEFRRDFLQYLVDALNRVGNAEPTDITTAQGREKQQKFGILDAPNLLASDLESPPGLFGTAVIYLDIDNFKAVNTRFTERVVDACVLPVVQRLVAAAVVNRGYAYAEGGDEMIVLLPNSTLLMGAVFAGALRDELSRRAIVVGEETLTITASFGVAAGAAGQGLAESANLAKTFAKDNGKNCVALSTASGSRIWTGGLII